MKATITSIKDKQQSKHGRDCMLIITFKGEDGKSYHTWMVSELRNYGYWSEAIKSGENTIIDGLKIKKGNLIDADSRPKIVGKEETKMSKINYDSLEKNREENSIQAINQKFQEASLIEYNTCHTYVVPDYEMVISILSEDRIGDYEMICPICNHIIKGEDNV